MTDALLTALQTRANSRGLALASEASLLSELRIGSATLRQGIQALEAEGAIEVTAPLPFLVAKLRPAWSGKKPNRPEMAAKSAASGHRADSFQSSLSQSKPSMKESYRQPGDEVLLREILGTLGETDPTTFRGAIRSYPVEVIRTALDRVRRNPGIRKNRTALFRYLLPRIAKEPPFTK